MSMLRCTNKGASQIRRVINTRDTGLAREGHTMANGTTKGTRGITRRSLLRSVSVALGGAAGSGAIGGFPTI